MTGAVSFRRWLGCAPTIVARVSHGSAAWEPAQRFLNKHRTDEGRSDPSWARSPRSTHRTRPLHRGRDAGWDDARIHREAVPPATYETFIRKELQGTRTHLTDVSAS